MTVHKDNVHQSGLRYWNSAWSQTREVQSFSPHTAFVERTKWRYLQEDLAKSNGKVLEIGCGSGHIGSLLAERGFDVVLLDNSQTAIDCAKNSYTALNGHERKTYVLGDARALPFPEESFDVVVSCGLLEHFEDMAPVIKEMTRVLKFEGFFYADICPRKYSLIRTFENMRKKADGWYEAKISKDDIRRIIVGSGLEIIRLFSAGVLPPRGIPGTGRLAFLAWLEKCSVEWFSPLWQAFDGTIVADWLGFYYYISARKNDR